MTKVEELRETLKKVLAAVHDEQVVSAIEEVIDSLISAAEFLGMKKQKELDAIWLRIDALGVAEARGFAKGHAEGVAEERERIRKANAGKYGNQHGGSGYYIPASVLAPKESEK
jgi:hypothetical protein